MLINLRLVQIGLLALAGCASVPDVMPPDPVRAEVDGQQHQFQGVMPAQVLEAAEVVLRQYRPKGHFNREGNTLVMEHQDWEFIGIGYGSLAEKWVVQAHQTESVTIGSVAMRIRGSGALLVLAGSYEYPNERRGMHIDYGMFWGRVQRALTGEVLVECDKRGIIESGAKYFEPLCSNIKVNRGETK